MRAASTALLALLSGCADGTFAPADARLVETFDAAIRANDALVVPEECTAPRSLDEVAAVAMEWFEPVDVFLYHEGLRVTLDGGEVATNIEGNRFTTVLERADFERVTGFLGQPGVLEAMADGCPCSLRTSRESAVVVVTLRDGRERRKNLYLCEEAVYRSWRALWADLRGRYGINNWCAITIGRNIPPCAPPGACQPMVPSLCDSGRWRCHQGTATTDRPFVPAAPCDAGAD